MKALLAVTLVLCVMLSMTAVAQNTPKAMGQKDKASAAPEKTIEGTVKAEGDQITFVSDKDKKTWKVENPEVLKGHEGHHVQVKAHVYADKGSIHIMDVKMVSAKSETQKEEMK